LETEKKLHKIVLELVSKKIINSAHDVSDGGIVCSLAECCIINQNNAIGADVNIPVKNREDFSLFSESQSRIIVSVSPDNNDEFLTLLKQSKLPFTFLGLTQEKDFVVNNKYSFSLEELISLYFDSIPSLMNEQV
jgi:phosphoribosylformylglycinamidine synthase